MRQQTRVRAAIIIAVAAVIVVVASPAMAQSTAIGMGSTVTTALQKFQTAISQWSTALTGVAQHLFLSLALIEVIWVGSELVLRNADFGEIISRVIMLTLFLGFFAGLLGFGNSPLPAQKAIQIIYDYFNSAYAATASATGSPQDFATLGITIIGQALGQFSMYPTQIPASLALLAAAFVSLVCLTLIAAMLVEAVLESYFVQYVGIIFFGFGATRWTKDYAIKILNYAVSVGAKVFCIQSLAGITYQLMLQLIPKSPSTLGLNDFFPIVVVSIMMLALTRSIPSHIQGLISGASINTSSSIVSAIKDVAEAVGGGAMLAGATAAVAGNHLSETISNVKNSGSAAEAVSQGVAGLMSMPARAGGELAKAALQDLGGKLSGAYDQRHGTAGARMASAIIKNMDKKEPPPIPSTAKE